MLAGTHITFAVLVGVIGLPILQPENLIAYFALLIFGALLVDIDHEGSTINKIVPVTRKLSKLFKHRGIFHSLWMPALLFFPFAYLSSTAHGIYFVMGYVSHLLSDCVTKQGINFLNPFTQFKIAGPVTTGTWMETIFLMASLGGIAVVLF